MWPLTLGPQYKLWMVTNIYNFTIKDMICLDANVLVCEAIECVSDLDLRSKMIVFELLLTTFAASYIEATRVWQYWKFARVENQTTLTEFNQVKLSEQNRM